MREITRRNVRELLEDVAERAPIQANRVLAVVRKMFNFAIERDWLDVNPCQMVKRVVREQPRDRVLTEDEIGAVWSALDHEQPLMAGLIRLRLLTAQRGGELHGAKWNEIDLTSGWWKLPAARSKNRLSHRVPLSPKALRIFKELHLITGESDWVFPSPGRSSHTCTTRRRHSSGSWNGAVSSSEVMTCVGPLRASWSAAVCRGWLCRRSSTTSKQASRLSMIVTATTRRSARH